MKKPIAETSIYGRIADGLRERMLHGEWPTGSMLPGRRDIAREYGVSLVTVERAIGVLISEGLLRTDNRRGTYATRMTEPLTNTETGDGRVGIVAPLYPNAVGHLELNNHLVQLLIESMESSLGIDGTETLFINRAQSVDSPLLPLPESLAEAATADVRGILLIALGTDPAEIDETLSRLIDSSTPVVCVTSGELRTPTPHVFYDNYAAGYQAARHLLDMRKRDIMVLAPFTAPWVRERIGGVCSAVEQARQFHARTRIIHAVDHPWNQLEDPEALGYEIGKTAILNDGKPDAVVCVNDGVAFGIIRAATELGLRIGDEIAVTGFDNHPRSITMGLTSLRAPMEAMGQEAVNLLRHEMRGDGTGFQVRLRWRLIPRASSRGVPTT